MDVEPAGPRQDNDAIESQPTEAAPDRVEADAAPTDPVKETAPAPHADVAPDASSEPPPTEVPSESAPSGAAGAPAGAAAPTAPDVPGEDASTAEAGRTGDERESPGEGEAQASNAEEAGEAEPVEAGDAKADKPKAKKKPRKPARKRPPPRHVEPPLSPELKAEAAAVALEYVCTHSKASGVGVRAGLELLDAGKSLTFVARFRRRETHGLDERHLRQLLAVRNETRQLEERRVAIREIVRLRGGLTEAVTAALQRADTVAEMEDWAAPYLPVVAGRATVARGLGLQGLADAIRAATEATPLSEVAQPYVKEDGEPTGFDAALGGARDILAEELSLDPALRARLRALFRKQAVLSVAARSDKRAEKKPEGGRHAALIGFQAAAGKILPMKILDLRRAEKERAVLATIEPPEEKALAILHAHVASEEHPHAGFLRAAAEDGYRRILKPLLQNEVRLGLKQKADDFAMEQFERTLRNLLLAPYAGGRRTLGLRPDVMNGHRWCAVDESGLPAGAGQLPHEPTAGREACLTELRQLIKTYEVSAIAVGTTGGRADAVSLAREAAADQAEGFEVAEVHDGGTRMLESLGPLEVEERPVVPAECRGALSLARRFQDPMAELVRIEPKALALGPHLHDVHQGRLRAMLEQVIESCVAHVGVDPARADADLMARLPGLQRKTAEAFVAWRKEHGPLRSKAALAAVDGIGMEIAEQAVGFLRIPDAEDPRDRTQLHPEQYEAVEKMAAQAGVDVPTLFADPAARQRVRVDDLADETTGPATYRYVLYEATAGHRDPRPRYSRPIPPPPEIKLDTIQPGLVLQGRVIRSAPFGVFVDVALGVEALIPLPHIGEHPGIEPATVAAVGSVINARVLEVDTQKKRLTLSMRRELPPRAPAGRPGGPRGPRAPGERPPARPAGRGERPAGQRSGAPRAPGGPGGPGRRPAGAGGGRPQKKGRFQGGGFAFGDGRRERYDRNTPRHISLKPDEPETPADTVDESTLSAEELMKRKLEALKKRLERPED